MQCFFNVDVRVRSKLVGLYVCRAGTSDRLKFCDIRISTTALAFYPCEFWQPNISMFSNLKSSAEIEF